MTMAKVNTASSFQLSAGFRQSWLPVIGRVFLFGGLLVLLVLLRNWMMNPLNTPLRQIDIEGEFKHLDKAQIQLALLPELDKGFFTVDVDAIHAQLKKLPWVNDVAVRRVWKDRLRIQITEQVAVANWGESAALNSRGEVFRPAKYTNDESLVFLDGPVNHAVHVLQMYWKVAGLLKQVKLSVSQLQLDERRAWHLQLNNGITMELGRLQLEQRLQRFVRSWPMVLAHAAERISVIDLRYSNGFAVRWQLDNSDKQAS